MFVEYCIWKHDENLSPLTFKCEEGFTINLDKGELEVQPQFIWQVLNVLHRIAILFQIYLLLSSVRLNKDDSNLITDLE